MLILTQADSHHRTQEMRNTEAGGNPFFFQHAMHARSIELGIEA